MLGFDSLWLSRFDVSGIKRTASATPYGVDRNAPGADGLRRRNDESRQAPHRQSGRTPPSILEPLQNLQPPCMQVTNRIAKEAKTAVDEGAMPEVVRKSMQLKKRAKEFEDTAKFEVATGVASAAMAVAGGFSPPAKAMLAASTLAMQPWPIAHGAVSARSGNAHRMAQKSIEENLGQDVAQQVSSLPYNAHGLSEARRILNRADPRFGVLSPDRRFNTRGLAENEVRKGGDPTQITNQESARAFAAPARSTAASTSMQATETLRRRR